ncbi:MAG: SDR family NAD(P)-dependent oxidoreductase [Planctomycetaceae bacterium]
MSLINNLTLPGQPVPPLGETSPRRARLSGKVAVVTGAGRGIGRTMALLFASEGAQVVVADINGETAREAAAVIAAEGGAAHATSVDITDTQRVRAMVADTIDRFRHLDILVNNAGVALNRPFLETTIDDWDHILKVVLTGTFLCSQAAARVMVQRGEGAIINIASISGQRGAQGRAAYGAAKAGVIQLTKVMAVELAVHGVRVNAVSPGPVATDLSNGTHTAATRRSYLDRIPLHRYGEGHEVAAAALFLASAESSFIHGHVLNVDGGFYAAGLMFDPDAH